MLPFQVTQGGFLRQGKDLYLEIPRRETATFYFQDFGGAFQNIAT